MDTAVLLQDSERAMAPQDPFLHSSISSRDKSLSPEYLSKIHVNLLIDGLSQRFVDVYPVKDPGGVHTVLQAHGFQRPVIALVPTVSLQERKHKE